MPFQPNSIMQRIIFYSAGEGSPGDNHVLFCTTSPCMVKLYDSVRNIVEDQFSLVIKQ